MADGYSVTIAGAGERTAEDVKACLGILDQGKAVSIRTAARELPVATVVVLARRGDAIVGVGAIKRARPQYARDRTADSGVPFDENTPELGYIAVDEQHQGHGLSRKIADALLATNRGTLFATTDNERMKRVLRKTAFERRGREWKGKRGFLSLWIRSFEVLIVAPLGPSA
jgi:RimJ/RimL family protein N-acetyltransferase